jgi:hypothetical protein
MTLEGPATRERSWIAVLTGDCIGIGPIAWTPKPGHDPATDRTG